MTSIQSPRPAPEGGQEVAHQAHRRMSFLHYFSSSCILVSRHPTACTLRAGAWTTGAGTGAGEPGRGNGPSYAEEDTALPLSPEARYCGAPRGTVRESYTTC